MAHLQVDLRQFKGFDYHHLRGGDTPDDQIVDTTFITNTITKTELVVLDQLHLISTVFIDAKTKNYVLIEYVIQERESSATSGA